MLSIVIPTCARSDLLEKCLVNVVRHAPAGSEILVVDDGSPRGRAKAVAAAFPGVRVLRNERRRGFARAANQGIRGTSGAIVELLNDDTEVQPGWADVALRWFREPHVAAVAPLVLAWPDGRQIDSAGDRYYLGGVATKRGHGQPLSSDYTTPCPVFGASASSAFYRRAALEHVGLFPESFGSYFEDVDLAFRLQRAGYTTMYEPGSRILHHVGASHRPGHRLLEQQAHNEERVFWRNVPARELLQALPKHLAVLLGKAWRRWQEGSLRPWLCGRLRVLKEIGAIRQHRRELRRLGEVAPLVERRYVP